MGEEVTASHGMSQPEDSTQGAQSLGGFLVVLVTVFDLDKPIVVRIPDVTYHPISRNLILEIDIRDGWPIIMRVEVLVCSGVPQSDFHPSGDILEGLIGPFCLGMSGVLG